MLRMLRQERPFAVLLGGQLLSRIGDGVHEFVFIVAVLQATGNAVAPAGLIYFCRFIPYLALGPLGGVLADRLRRRWLMLHTDLARMGVTLGLCALLVTGQAGPVWLALIGMLMTALRTLFQPAFQAAIPSLVRAGHLPAANALTQIAAEAGGLVGPALGAVALSAWGSAGHVLLLDAATYLGSALCIALTPMAEPAAARAADSRLTPRALYGEFGRHLAEVLGQAPLRVAILYSATCILLVGAALRILIPALLRDAGHADDVIGYAMSLMSLGAILGAALFTQLARDFSTRALMRYWALYGLVLALLPAGLVHLAVFLAGCVVLGVSGAFVDVVLPTRIHQLSRPDELGKNFSLFSTLANAGEALSGGLAALLVLVSSVAMSLTTLGLLVAAVACLGRWRAAEPAAVRLHPGDAA